MGVDAADVPTLAFRIHQGNTAGESKINLKGIMVGNGCTGTEVGVCSAAGTAISVDYLHAHGLYSTVLYNQIQSTCKDLSNPDSACQTLLNEMSDAIGNVDIYDIVSTWPPQARISPQPTNRCIISMCVSGSTPRASAVARLRSTPR